MQTDFKIANLLDGINQNQIFMVGNAGTEHETTLEIFFY